MVRQADLEALRIDRGQRRRAGGGGPRGAVYIIILLLFVTAIYFFRGPIREALDRWRLPQVRSFVVTRSSLAEIEAVKGLSANGYVVAGRRAALSPDSPGRIVELSIEEGRRVSRGQLIARLYDAPARASLAQAEAEVKGGAAREARAGHVLAFQKAELGQLEAAVTAAEAALDGARAVLNLAKKDCDRSEKLRAKGAVGAQAFDRARSTLIRADADRLRLKAVAAGSRAALVAARARLVVAEADIEVAQTESALAAARLDGARANLSKTEIRAPFAGIVVLKDAELGEVVSPNVQGGGARGSIVTLVDFNSLEVQVDVPEANLSSVIVGGGARVFLDAFPGEPYSGRVERIWPTANRQKATVEVRVSVFDPDDRLRPEMGARVVFIDPDTSLGFDPALREEKSGTKAAEEIFIPESAVATVDGVPGVFVLERDLVRLTPVTLGPRRKDRLMIKAGVEVGQRLVLNPPYSLGDGDRVRLEKAP